MFLPFRWKIEKREQLGRLTDGQSAETYPMFLDELRQCCARVVASSANGTMYFIGRSPESIFDYLTGILTDTTWQNRLILMNISLKGAHTNRILKSNSQTISKIRNLLSAVSLNPDATISSERPAILIDLVFAGETFGHLTKLLLNWAKDLKLNLKEYKQHFRFLGITEQKKTSPKTWRWQQQTEWAKEFPSRALKSISIPYSLWTYLGNYQHKVSYPNPPKRWGKEELLKPSRDQKQLEALRLAVQLFDLGKDPNEREKFVDLLATQREMRYEWLRNLVIELRRNAPRR